MRTDKYKMKTTSAGDMAAVARSGRRLVLVGCKRSGTLQKTVSAYVQPHGKLSWTKKPDMGMDALAER
jgi:hypothetical protein